MYEQRVDKLDFFTGLVSATYVMFGSPLSGVFSTSELMVGPLDVRNGATVDLMIFGVSHR